MPRESVVQETRLEVLSRSVEGEPQLRSVAVGQHPVWKVSDDKIYYNRANFVSFYCFLPL